MSDPSMTKDEWCARFKAHMIAQAPFDRFENEDGTDAYTVAEYADETAAACYDDPDQRAEGPEACADADMSYWGE